MGLRSRELTLGGDRSSWAVNYAVTAPTSWSGSVAAVGRRNPGHVDNVARYQRDVKGLVDSGLIEGEIFSYIIYI